MTDFLLELRSEEIPARMQAGAKASLELLFLKQMEAADVAVGTIEVFATPRRLALIAHDLPIATDHKFEDIKGPRIGAPPQALEGFLRKVALTEDNLVQSDGVWWARLNKPGRPMQDVLAEAIPAIIRAFPWPKSQRWGAASVSTESLRWVRPLQGIVALLGDNVVPCEIDGIVSGAATMGHRFHHKGPVTIGNAGDYIEKLRACHVIVHFSERCAIIRNVAKAAAAAAGLTLVEDEGLVTENAGLTEWPVPMLGRFNPAFLDVPEEVIQLTARVNQKYFVCKSSPARGGGARAASDGGAPLHHPSGGPPPRAGEERLAPAFVCTANIVANDGGAAIVAGNEKVLAARLSDAKFFWEQDLKVALDDQAKKLSQITFHEKLGTVADKVERVAKLARWLVEEGIVKSSPERGGGGEADGGVPPLGETANVEVGPLHHPAGGPPPRAGEDLANQAERAARLCKADLVTGMVGEFPELQGIMGGYYAREQGESDAVADAIRDHYKPVGQGDEVPTASVTVVVSLADKLDTLVGFFATDQKPTGSKDPFALRRSSLSVLGLVIQNNSRLRLVHTFKHTFQILRDQLVPNELPTSGLMKVNLGQMVALSNVDADVLGTELLDFFADRLKVQQREAGVRHDLIDAVFALGGEDDLVRLLARVKALQAFVATEEGVNLLAGYKRAANILKSSPGRGGGGEADGGGPPLGTSENLEVEPLRPSGAPPRAGEELALLTALDTAEPKAAAAVEAEDFEGAMAALASLRSPIDAFFDGVMVNDPDPAKRAFRLGLLARFRDAVHRVADFSRIEG